MKDRRAHLVDALRRAVFDSDAVTPRQTRAAAASGMGTGAGTELSRPMASYLALVRDASYRITDADVAGLLAAGHTEEEVFELTVAAAVGAALGRREAGMRALRGEG